MRKLARDDRGSPAVTQRLRPEVVSPVPQRPGESPSTATLVRRRDAMSWSLSLKLLAGYVVAGAGLAVALWFVPRNPLLWAAYTVASTVILGLLLSTIFVRLGRVRSLNRAAFEISRGELAKEIGTEPGIGLDEIDELSTAVEHMRQNLHDLVGHIQRTAKSVSESADDLQRSAEGVNASNDEVAISMKKIAGGADEQRLLVERASKIIGEMAASIQQAARSAEDAARAASDTSGAAEFSGNAARLAGEKVKKVFAGIEAASKEVFAFGERTKEINKIVDAITRVAQQTNLLALNATIEAARAGEYGRGFAVVAEEVRKLAEAAGRSAEQISELAGEISDHSNAVVAAMGAAIQELGDGREDLNSIIRALETITDTARKGAEKVAHISEASREQLKGSEEMVTAISHISSVAGQNAASTQEVNAVIQDQTASMMQMTSSAQELTNLSVELQTVVSRFRLQ